MDNEMSATATVLSQEDLSKVIADAGEIFRRVSDEIVGANVNPAVGMLTLAIATSLFEVVHNAPNEAVRNAFDYAHKIIMANSEAIIISTPLGNKSIADLMDGDGFARNNLS